MAKKYIVWNEDRSEGFVTDDRRDAETARKGKKHRRSTGQIGYSTLALAFFEAYGEDKLPPIQEVEIP